MKSSIFTEILESRTYFAIELITNNLFPTAYDQANGLISFTVEIINGGNTDAPRTTNSAVILSKDQKLGGDIVLQSIPATELTRFTTKTLKPTVRIPGTVAAGNYYLGVALDIDNLVAEFNEADNVKFTLLPITVPETFALAFEGTAGNDTITVSSNASDIGISIQSATGKSTYTYPRHRVASLSANGLAGNDLLQATNSDFPVYFMGGEGHDKLQGGSANDILSGNAGKDTIHGGGGNDRLNGHGGNDRLFGETGPDRLYGYAGNDYLDGGSSKDRLEGGAGIDTVYGQSGDDVFFAKDGAADVLFGGSGRDTGEFDPTDLKSSIVG